MPTTIPCDRENETSARCATKMVTARSPVRLVSPAPAWPRRVLQIHNYYQQSGGEDSVVANERALLVKNGHEVFQYSVHNDSISSVLDKARVFIDVKYSHAARRELAEELAKVRPDVAHVHNFFPLLTTSVYDACRDAGIPIVQTLHNYRITCAGVYLMRNGQICERCVDGSAYWGTLYRCYRGSTLGSFAVSRMIDSNRRRGTWSSKVDRFIALTASAKSLYIRAGLPPDRITVKPNFAEDPGEIPDPRSRHGALFIGRLSPEKGVREIVSAWEGIDYPLRIAGDGPLADELKSKAPGNVTFLGRIGPEQVRQEMLRAAFLVAFSTWYEGFPVVLAEAFAAGLPAIVSDIGALKDTVTDGVTGRHVRAGDARALRETIKALIPNHADLERMSARARAEYLTKYNPQSNYAQLRDIYMQVAEQKVSLKPSELPSV